MVLQCIGWVMGCQCHFINRSAQPQQTLTGLTGASEPCEGCQMRS